MLSPCNSPRRSQPLGTWQWPSFNCHKIANSILCHLSENFLYFLRSSFPANWVLGVFCIFLTFFLPKVFPTSLISLEGSFSSFSNFFLFANCYRKSYDFCWNFTFWFFCNKIMLLFGLFFILLKVERFFKIIDFLCRFKTKTTALFLNRQLFHSSEFHLQINYLFICNLIVTFTMWFSFKFPCLFRHIFIFNKLLTQITKILEIWLKVMGEKNMNRIFLKNVIKKRLSVVFVIVIHLLCPFEWQGRPLF